jgi:hypothetical protein
VNYGSAIDNPARCKICAVIHFLHTKILSAVENQCELFSVVCHQNVTREGTVQQ